MNHENFKENCKNFKSVNLLSNKTRNLSLTFVYLLRFKNSGKVIKYIFTD